MELSYLSKISSQNDNSEVFFHQLIKSANFVPKGQKLHNPPNSSLILRNFYTLYSRNFQTLYYRNFQELEMKQANNTYHHKWEMQNVQRHIGYIYLQQCWDCRNTFRFHRHKKCRPIHPHCIDILKKKSLSISKFLKIS